MSKGAQIRYDVGAGKFVHASCARVQRVPVVPTVPAGNGRSPRLPPGLKTKTLEGYTSEWSRYAALARRQGHSDIPGRDGPWDMELLWQYMSFRGRTCKPQTVTAGLSALSYFGVRFNQLLATSRHDSDSLMYRQISLLKQQLAIDYNERCGGVLYGPNRCTPVGHRTVSLILSAFAVKDRRSFLRLSRSNRHHVALMVMQHSAAMRFGHFPARGYRLRQFKVDDRLGDITIVTDWHRYAGRRRYRLHFPAVPEEMCRWYAIRDQQGEVLTHLSAATILRWHFDQIRSAQEQQVFAPTPGGDVSRADRQRWLRGVLLAALPLQDESARAMVQEVTPHSFRPGMAADYLREGWQLDAIAIRCRWQGTRNARMYAERMLLADARRDTSFRSLRRDWA